MKKREKINILGVLFVSLFFLGGLLGCSNSSSGPDPQAESPTPLPSPAPPTNTAPVADAGSNQTVDENTAVTLDGIGSSDANGDSLTHSWTQTGDATVTLSDPSSSNPTFTAPSVGVGGETLAFQLIVNDGVDDGAPDSVTITVSNVNNKSPVLDLIADISVNEGETVTFSPTAADPDGDPLTFTYSGWMTTSTYVTTYNDAGQYTVTVTVSDGDLTDSQDVTVTVIDVAIMATVPDVLGMAQAAAESAIVNANLTVGAVTTANSDTVPAGEIISQTPSGGTSVPENTSVDLVVSLGPVGTPPPDPGDVAPDLDTTVNTDMAAATAFLYTGATLIQTGVAPGTIVPKRAAVLRGKVLDRGGNPVSAVAITILGHPEFGQTLSRLDGMFDMAVNGGGILTVDYRKNGYLPTQRQVDSPWQDYIWVADVVMIQKDPQVTAIDLTSADPMQAAQGSVVTDSDGTRQATVFIPQGTQASVILGDGTLQPVSTLNISLTEYTEGASGSDAMPGKLPPTSAYTYAIEISAEETVTKVDGKDVIFNQPLPVYVDNFIGFPVGTTVPVGYYDNDRGVWVPSKSGRIIEILGITGGMADLDVDGDGTIDTGTALTDLGITDPERIKLAELYAVNDTLWRFRVEHFSTYDANWSYRWPDDAERPRDPRDPRDPDNPCEEGGSIIECQSQVLGEEVGLTGTPFSLNYRSSRVPGRKTASNLDIPLSGAAVPASLLRIELEIQVAGRDFKYTAGAANQCLCGDGGVGAFCGAWFPLITIPLENQSYTFQWDGMDAYGRTLQGKQPLTGRIGYTYCGGSGAGYQATDTFGNAGTGMITGGGFLRRELTLWQEWQGSIGPWDSRPQGLGAWSLNVHHVYDPVARVLYKGDGSRRSAESLNKIITTVAGNGWGGYCLPDTCGDGGPATEARLFAPQGVVLGPDGSLYISDWGNARVRRVDPDGIITTVAGNGTGGYSGDGGPATEAQLSGPWGLALGPDGSLYISSNMRIRRVDPNGIITTVAGNGTYAYSGDGGPATEAQLMNPLGVAVGPDGSLYIASRDSARVRRVDPDGIITTVAGNGWGGHGGDGGPATEAQLGQSVGVAVGPDGSLYIADGNWRIRRVGPDGIITTVAGNGWGGYSGDGGPATQAQLNQGVGVAVGPDGSLYISDQGNSRIRRVGPDGIITTVAGNGSLGYNGDGGPATVAQLWSPSGVALGPDGSLYISDMGNSRIRRVDSLFPGMSGSEILIPSADGSEVYIFNSAGKHLRTIHALTNAVLYRFTYDTNGLLIRIEDGDNNITTIQRDTNGDPATIIAPFGQRTRLTLDTNGYLATITNPANETNWLTYSADGLLATLIDPMGRTYTFTYDSLGRLIKDEDPAGGYKNIARTDITDGYEVSVTTAMNRVTTYRTETLSIGGTRSTKIDPNGAITEIIVGTDGSRTVTSPDGTITTIVNGPDPRFGMQAPVLNSLTITSPGGITKTITSSRAVTLTDPGDLLSLQTLQDTQTVNSRTFTYGYDAATLTFTSTTPEGYQTVALLDGQGRTVDISLGTGVDPIMKSYDIQGRLIRIEQGAQLWNYGYDSLSRIISRTDAAGNNIFYNYDNADRLIDTTLPEGGIEQYAYDYNGNRTEMTMPSGDIHTLGYTVRNLLAVYTPPGSTDFLREYDLDKALISLTLAGGRITDNSFDTGGRWTGVSYPEAVVGMTYTGATERMATLTHTPTGSGIDQQVDYTYDGGMVDSMTWTGTANGSYQYTYDNNFFISGITLNSGADTVQQSFTRDTDGMVTGFGTFTMTRNGPGGALTQLNDSALTMDIAYDTLRRTESRIYTVNSNQVYGFVLTRDNTGRIIQKIETAAGVSKTYDYTYDTNGQLVETQADGAIIETYTYDANGNRLSTFSAAAGYDNQDRLTDHGGVNYTFDNDGFLTQRGSDSFQYSARGELLSVTIGANTITYTYDGLGRRTGRTDAAGTYQYLYGNPDNPFLITAMRDQSGVLAIPYYDEEGLLFAIERGGNWYYLGTDQVGTPLVVADSTGLVVKKLEYDSFGLRISDSNPAFDLPFGFAGGLEDPVTGLVRFGFRDYDQVSGRWTARDPVLYDGGQSNLYVYVNNNPVSQRDPLGLWCVGGSLYGGVGAGAQLCCNNGKCSICGEVGFGVGASVGIGGGDSSGTGVGVEGSAGAGCGPLSAGVKCSFSTDPCGTGCVGEGQAGGYGINTKGEGKLSKSLMKTKCGFQAKVNAKGCKQW